MSSTKKRIRVFAGPNGSGKTTIMTDLRNRIHFGVYVNADDIEKELHENGSVDLSQYQIAATTLEIQHYFRKSQFAPLKLNIPDLFSHISIFQRRIILSSSITPDSYIAADMAEWIREELLQSGVSFSYETVMSHPGKLDFLAKAIHEGYRVYLYFVATEDPEINVNRVDIRVSQSGHAVSPEIIKKRYYKSLGNLKKAVLLTDRAYLFDNSGSISKLVATIMNSNEVEIVDPATTPNWVVQYLAD
jgi:predicted ABC-type ATPase